MKLRFSLFASLLSFSAVNGLEFKNIRGNAELLSKHTAEADPLKLISKARGIDTDRKLLAQSYGFGQAVDISPAGTTIIIGAPLSDIADDTIGGTDAGLIRIYTGNALAFQYIGQTAGELLGTSVAMIGETMAVAGAPGYDSGAGVLDLFTTDGTAWSFTESVFGAAGEGLGRSIDSALSTPKFVVGTAVGFKVMYVTGGVLAVADSQSQVGTGVGISDNGLYVAAADGANIILYYCPAENTACTATSTHAGSPTNVRVADSGSSVVLAASTSGTVHVLSGATNTTSTSLVEQTAITAECSLDGFGASMDMTYSSSSSTAVLSIGQNTKAQGEGSVAIYNHNITSGVSTKFLTEQCGVSCEEQIGRATAMSTDGASVVNCGFGICRVFTGASAQTGVITVESP